MKYVRRDLGASAENSSGGGGRGVLRETAVLGALTALGLGVLYLIVGLVTDWAVRNLSPEREARFFEEFYADQFNEEVPESLAGPWDLAEATLDKLRQAPGVVPLDYRLGYLSDPNPNAFAVPGGRIVLTRGLLESLDEEISIAFVLAHELGHFAGRDHLQQLGRKIGVGAGLMILTGGGHAALDSTASLLTLNYSRAEETAADRFALEAIDTVYGTREGADRLFQILQESHALPGWAYMFKTHPDTAERIQAIREK